MFARTLFASILSALVLLTGPGAGAEKNGSDIEKAMLEKYQKNGEITINLESGKIVIVGKDLKDRKLMFPVMMRFDEKQKLESICWAKEAAIRYDSTIGALSMTIQDCNVHSFAGGGDATMQTKVWNLRFLTWE